MSHVINFNNVTKKYLTVTLADEKKTTIFISTPTKSIMDELFSLQSSLDSIGEGDVDPEIINAMYRTCAEVMSRNKAGKKITADYLAKNFDFEDIIIFFKAYMDFIDEVINQKN